MLEYEKVSDWLKCEVDSHDFINVTELSGLMKFGIFVAIKITDGDIEIWLHKKYMGRGTSYRADVSQLAKAGL